MLILKLRQAEVALADRRLDHAYEMVRSDAEMAGHARGQRLVSHLVKAYLTRGREHLTAGRLDEAMADCDRARRLAGNVTEVAELRSKVVAAVMETERRKQRHEHEVRQAANHVQHGRLSTARRLIATMSEPHSHRVQTLAAQVEQRGADLEAALSGAAAALDRDDAGSAIDHLVAARRGGAAGDRYDKLVNKAIDASLARAQTALRDGRIDAAETALQRVAPLAAGRDAFVELTTVVHHCRDAANALATGDARVTLESLRRIAHRGLSAAWIREAITQAERTLDNHDALRCGPLGTLLTVDSMDRQNAGATGSPASAQRGRNDVGNERGHAKVGNTGGHVIPGTPLRQPSHHMNTLPTRFLLQVDGVGAFLVIRDAAVTVGPISSSRRPVVGLVTDPTTPVVNVQRADEDYFLRAEQPVRINEAAASSKLLTDGDRVQLSPRCRFKFAMPNAASGTAVLDFTSGGGRLPRADMRHVILLSDTLIIGPAASAHVRTSQIDQPIVLQLRDGVLRYKGDTAIVIDDVPVIGNDDPVVTTNARVRVDTLTFVMTEV